ncbi:MAG: TSUP family transporter, partial [Alphaproteobacteria bacterium]|nr:TSUP family transporter [Alphaproteobacteria bacterium]
ALLLAAASLLFRQKLLVRPAPGIVLPPLLRGILTILVGMAIGVLVSISSVGAGALGMPALLWLHRQYGLPRLVGTDIAHAVPLTLVAGLGHWAIGSVDGALLVSLLVGSLPAVVVGSRLAPHMAERGLRIALAVMLALVGIKLLAG